MSGTEHVLLRDVAVRAMQATLMFSCMCLADSWLGCQQRGVLQEQEEYYRNRSEAGMAENMGCLAVTCSEPSI